MSERGGVVWSLDVATAAPVMVDFQASSAESVV